MAKKGEKVAAAISQLLGFDQVQQILNWTVW